MGPAEARKSAGAAHKQKSGIERLIKTSARNRISPARAPPEQRPGSGAADWRCKISVIFFHRRFVSRVGINYGSGRLLLFIFGVFRPAGIGKTKTVSWGDACGLCEQQLRDVHTQIPNFPSPFSSRPTLFSQIKLATWESDWLICDRPISEKLIPDGDGAI